MVIWRLIRRGFGWIWRLLSGISRVVTVLIPLVFLGFLVTGIVIGLRGADTGELPERGALLLNPEGVLVETRTPLAPLDAFMQADTGEVLLSDVIEAIDTAADDDRITALVMDLQLLAGPSVSQTLEIVPAIERFRASGKPIVAYGDYFDQGQYALAAQADDIILHTEGGVNLQGFAVYRSYVKQLLENIHITMNVFRVGENKSAVEPYLRDDMSASEREVVGRWLGDLWQQYARLVEQGRELEPGYLDQFIAEFPDRLEAYSGDLGIIAQRSGFVDDLLTYDQLDDYLLKVVGATDDDEQWAAIPFDSYLRSSRLRATHEDDDSATTARVIAVVPIEGELIPGESAQGFAGSDTVLEQLERALEIDGLAGLVVRINSPGGSVFASEVIRQKLLDIGGGDIPVVASMGSVAASGGYYIAADADEIWAHPSTITGSIGVFAAFPTLENLYQWAGVNVDGVTTTPLAASVRADTGIDESGKRIINSVITRVYEDFVDLVANGRDMTWDDVNAIAGGIVWSGEDAQTVGLVDHLGGLEAAVAAAATRAGVEDYETRRVGIPLSPEQLILEEVSKNFGQVAMPGRSLVMRLGLQLAVPLRAIDSLQDPGGVYVRCLECAGSF